MLFAGNFFRIKRLLYRGYVKEGPAKGDMQGPADIY